MEPAWFLWKRIGLAGEETENGRQIAGTTEEDGIPYSLLLIT